MLVHNPPFTLTDQPEPDRQNSCAPPTPSYAHPNLELGPFALCCFCLHSAFQLNTFSSNKCNFSGGAQMRASTSRTSPQAGGAALNRSHARHFPVALAHWRLTFPVGQRSHFPRVYRVELCCLYRPAAARCRFGAVKVGPERSGAGRSEASRSDCSRKAKLRRNLLRRQPQN